MNRVFSLFSLGALLSLAIACSGDDDVDGNDNNNSSSSSSGGSSGNNDGSSSGGSSSGGSSSGGTSSGGTSSGGSSSGQSGEGECQDVTFVYPAAKPALNESEYSDHLVLTADAPFEVIARYEIPVSLDGGPPQWLPHREAMLLSSVDFTTGAITAHVLTAPENNSAALVDTPQTFAKPESVPSTEPYFTGFPPLLPLSGDGAYLLPYTSGAPRFHTLAYQLHGRPQLQYHALSLFTGMAQRKGSDEERWYINGFSALGHAEPRDGAPGLYVNDTCDGGKLTANCQAGFKLLAFPEGASSGPAKLDASGALYAAYYMGASTSVQVQALGRCAAANATSAQNGHQVADLTAPGSIGMAALPASAARSGLLLHVPPVSYTEWHGAQIDLVELSYAADGSISGAAPKTGVITLGASAESLNVVSDNQGTLWVTVAGAGGGADYAFQLQRK